LILFLPLFREHYQGGIYVTWHRPVTIITEYLADLHGMEQYLMILILLTVSYLISSVIAFIFSKIIKRTSEN